MPTSRNVSRAVARSRAVRASAARRRRRALALAAGLATIAGAPVAWFMAEPAGAIVATAVSKARDLADLLGERSPGTRTAAELTKHARVASKVRTHPKPAAPAAHPTVPGIVTTTALVDLLQPPIAPVGVVSEGPQPLAPPTTLNAILASTPSVVPFAPPSDGGGPAHFPPSEPREELPPTSAVPEPGTWATMLMGFALIGWRLRRRRGASRAKSVRQTAG